MALKNEQTLIEHARKGDSAALDALATAVQPRLRAYLLRVTLDYTLTDDMVQENDEHESLAFIVSSNSLKLFFKWRGFC